MGKFASPSNSMGNLKNGRQMNFEIRKMVMSLLFFTPYRVIRTKGYIAKTSFEAAKEGREANDLKEKKERGGEGLVVHTEDREGGEKEGDI